MADLKKQLGATLELYRTRAGLNQSQLAERCGLDRVTIARMESGVQWPRYENLEVIARSLGITPEMFFSGVQADDPREAALKDMLELLRMLAAIDNPELRRTFLDAVRRLAEGFASGAAPGTRNEHKKSS